ncbi:hypothetical protein QBC38DRAFT_475716 [Podospora fimiseda]|uniref:Uncharacterized protein n=1 Tax=Podospora fimiseda TaxID=252190 RepID=A0AAN7BSH8_9PEZI|nr:hypothetical protein QBC38DRAFT_475716 [Podospora fimiseda]
MILFHHHHHHLLLFLLCSLPLLTLAIPTTWTLLNLARTCTPDASSCLYLFNLDQNPNNNSPYSLDDYTTCYFPVYPFSSLPANQTDFNSVSCLHTDRFSINGGYNSELKFWTLVITDVEKGEHAFFGYTDDELSNGEREGVVPKNGKVLTTKKKRTEEEGEWSGGGKEKEEYLVRSRRGKRKVRSREENEDDGGNGKTWQILGLSRVQNSSDDTTKVGFKIKDSDGLTAHCSLTLSGSNNDISWFGKVCKGFKISWGYKPDTDGGVMTVCYPQNGTAAWFGWDGISYQTEFGDSLRRGVHEIGCA